MRNRLQARYQRTTAIGNACCSLPLKLGHLCTSYQSLRCSILQSTYELWILGAVRLIRLQIPDSPLPPSSRTVAPSQLLFTIYPKKPRNDGTGGARDWFIRPLLLILG